MQKVASHCVFLSSPNFGALVPAAVAKIYMLGNCLMSGFHCVFGGMGRIPVLHLAINAQKLVGIRT